MKIIESIRAWWTEKARLRRKVAELEAERSRQEQAADRLDLIRREQVKDIGELRDQLKDRQRRMASAMRKPEKKMKPGEVLEALSDARTSPVWLAVHQELDEAIAAAVDSTSALPSERNTAENRTFNAGGIYELRELQLHLIELLLKAEKDDEPLKEDDGD